MYIAYSHAYMTHPGCAALCSGAADFMKAPGNFDLYNLQGASHQGQTGSDPEHISAPKKTPISWRFHETTASGGAPVC
jgi:hypothetical protein